MNNEYDNGIGRTGNAFQRILRRRIHSGSGTTDRREGWKMNNRERVKHFYESVVSNHLMEEVPEYISKRCVLRTGEDAVPVGLSGMIRHLIDVRKTYPDYTMKIIRQYEDGDTVVSEFIMEGTHRGEWLGMKPTHKKLSFTGVDIDTVADGKITEHGGAVNTFETLLRENIIKPV